MKMEHLALPMFLAYSFSFQEGGKEIFVSFNTTLNSCIRFFFIPGVGWGDVKPIILVYRVGKVSS